MVHSTLVGHAELDEGERIEATSSDVAATVGIAGKGGRFPGQTL